MALIPQSNRIRPHAERVSRLLLRIPPRAFTFFKNITPIKTGNARNNTNYESKPNGGVIKGDYPYVNRLNEGYSQQAKNGMTQPTIQEIRRLVRRIL